MATKFYGWTLLTVVSMLYYLRKALPLLKG